MIVEWRADPRYYVYTHSKDGKVFYVGKGCGSRAFETKGRNNNWLAMTFNAAPFDVEILEWFDSEVEAFSREAELIEKLRPSCNLAGNPYSEYLSVEVTAEKPFEDEESFQIAVDSLGEDVDARACYLAIMSEVADKTDQLGYNWKTFERFKPWFDANYKPGHVFYFANGIKPKYSEKAAVFMPSEVYRAFNGAPVINDDNSPSLFGGMFKTKPLETEDQAEAMWYYITGVMLRRMIPNLTNEQGIGREMYARATETMNYGRRLLNEARLPVPNVKTIVSK